MPYRLHYFFFRCLIFVLFIVGTKATSFVGNRYCPISQADTAPAAEQVVYLMNNVRRSKGLSPLKIDRDLSNIAQAQANYQYEIKTITHDSPQGNLQARQSQGGHTFSYAEICTWAISATESMKSWATSPPHWNKIINPSYVLVGVAIQGCFFTAEFSQGVSSASPEVVTEEVYISEPDPKRELNMGNCGESVVIENSPPVSSDSIEKVLVL